MILSGPNTRLELHIPRRRKKERNSELSWVLVQIAVQSPQGSWEAMDACLTYEDPEVLALWFERIASGALVDHECEFIEPNLRLEWLPDGILRVFFEMEFHRDWSPGNPALDSDCWVDLTPSPQELREAAASLRQEVAAAPIQECRFP